MAFQDWTTLDLCSYDQDMTLQVLDGKLQATLIPLKQSYVFSGSYFADKEMHKNHASIILDSGFQWKIKGLSGMKLRISSEEVESISLIPGLVFHIGQTGFKVLKRSLPPPSLWEKESAEFLDKLELNDLPHVPLHFFLLPVQILFLQGPQSGNIYTLSYGPRILGSNNLDLNLSDPSQPHQLLKFSQVGDQILIENLADENAVLINKTPFRQHILTGLDRFCFGSNIVEISILT